MDYPLDHFVTYAKLIRKEMTNRGYRTMNRVWDKIVSVKLDWKEIEYNNLFSCWMDDIYLKICYYNLLEKFICGGIDETFWMKIENIYNIKRKKEIPF